MALEHAWLFLKRVVLPESKEYPSEDLIMWHLKQRQLGNWAWNKMPRPKARTTHGFQGQPIPTNEEMLANPPEDSEGIEMDRPEGGEEWQRKVQMRLRNDENQAARREWYGLKQ